ncbi:hypothetical protein JB92DRAFT_2877227 [Gautieria morchelliformis]|nr:hypothetical protein JB92DRAFT_2877227 [Gautieria morchelliformis]
MEVDKPEKELYKPVTKLLTEISCFVHRMHVEKGFTSALTDNDSLLMFIIRASSVKDADNGEVPDIVGVDATAEEVTNYLEKDVLPDRLVSLHWSQLLSVGHINLAEMPDDWDTDDLVQSLSYVWCIDRYQPNRFVHTAIMAYKTGFLTLQCLPDSMAVSSNHSYDDHEALVRYVYALYYPGSGAETQLCEFTNLKPIQRSSDEPKTNASTTALKPSFKYTVKGDNETAEYSIFDHFHGSSFSRQVYVGLGAIAIKSTRFPRVVVLKVYSRGLTRRFHEEDILQKIHEDGYLPGVPRISKDVSEQPFPLPRNHSLDRHREACMVPLTTTGESLSKCKNVLQFLKAMYDLTEVHRILMEKKDILHRDISWANILINHKHFEGLDEGDHEYPFIDSILKKPVPRVQVLLADFDNAMIIGGAGKNYAPNGTELVRCKEDEQHRIIGTPAFIAEVLARPSLAPVKYIIFKDMQDLNKAITPHPQADRDSSDKQFFKELAGYERLNDKHVSHQAIHDAESIFWVIVFFMVRANPKGSDSHKNIRMRSETFDAIVSHQIGKRISIRRSYFEHFREEDWAEMLPEKLAGFSATLYQLWEYFSFPWHGIQVPPKHQFHAHNLLQRLLFQEIGRLTEMEDSIELELAPLPVHSRLAGTQRTGTLGGSLHLLPQKKPQTEDSSEAPPAKRRKHKQSRGHDGDVRLCISWHEVV